MPIQSSLLTTAAFLITVVHTLDCNPPKAVGIEGIKTMDPSNNNCAASCYTGFAYSSGTPPTSGLCTACSAGMTVASGVNFQVTTCSACPPGYFCIAPPNTTSDNSPILCPSGSYCPSGSSSPLNCSAGSYCPAGSSLPTICSAGSFCPAGSSLPLSCFAGFYCPVGSSAPLQCPEDSYSNSASTGISGCVLLAVQVPRIVGCQAYATSSGVSCAVSQSGYVSITPGVTASSITACVSNCKKCSASTFIACSQAMEGYFINTLFSNIQKCAEGCQACTYNVVSPNKNDCTATLAGYQLVSQQPVMCQPGSSSLDGNTTPLCSTICNKEKNCLTCSSPDLCQTCMPRYLFNAADSTCVYYDQRQIHTTCKEGIRPDSNSCQSCHTEQNREFHLNTTTASNPTTISDVGRCQCQVGYYEQLTGKNPVDLNCYECGPNISSCTWTLITGTSDIVCKPGYLLAGQSCVLGETTSAPVGFFLDTSLSPNVFRNCAPNCSSCYGVNATQCTGCFDKEVATFTPIARSDSAYVRTFIGLRRALVNNTCLDICPVSFVANQERNGCVAASFSETLAGIFSVFAALLIFL